MTNSKQAALREIPSGHDAVQLSMMPTQWGTLQDIHDVEPINSGDYACLAEVRDILKKYGKSERFGIALLHKHFDMADNELLVENTDKENRVLTIQPALKGKTGKVIETQWSLQEGGAECMLRCESSCEYDNFSQHTGHRNHDSRD